MHTQCPQCGKRAVRAVGREGRTVGYRNIGALAIPPTYPIPTCSRCHAEYWPRADQILEAHLRAGYQIELQRRGAQAITQVCKHISQRRLERLLGLSQGYLSRLKSEASTASAALVSLLHLLASEPSRLAELDRFWLLPRP